jgi:triacylglycerol lipase
MPFTDSSVVPYGLLVMHAMDIYRQKTCPPSPVGPPPPPTGGGTLIGYILGTDTILLGHPQINTGPLQGLSNKVCYGTVIRRSPTEVVVALRGTDGFAEWAEDGQFLLMPYAPAMTLPVGTDGVSVEQGFWGIYQSLVLTDVAGTVKGPIAEQLPSILYAADQVVVAGHSLGAPLATYLTLDLVRGSLGQRVSGCYFASPHPGNQAFATLFGQNVHDYVVYNYLLDIVPRVPPTEAGYSSLSNVRRIQPSTAQAVITFDVGCNHHIVCYLAMLDYTQAMRAITPVPAGEESSAKCIRGPNTGKPTLAQSLVAKIVEVVG